MDLSQAALIVGKNAVVSPLFSDSSFVGRLHEEAVWDHVLFGEWCDAIRSYAAGDLPREIRAMAFDTYAYVVGVALISHIDPKDGYRIKNINRDKFFEIKDEIDVLFDLFLGSRRYSASM